MGSTPTINVMENNKSDIIENCQNVFIVKCQQSEFTPAVVASTADHVHICAEYNVAVNRY